MISRTKARKVHTSWQCWPPTILRLKQNTPESEKNHWQDLAQKDLQLSNRLGKVQAAWTKKVWKISLKSLSVIDINLAGYWLGPRRYVFHYRMAIYYNVNVNCFLSISKIPSVSIDSQKLQNVLRSGVKALNNSDIELSPCLSPGIMNPTEYVA